MEEFARDIGYLDKFFDKLAGHAATTKSSALAAFIVEERRRWAYALQLLEGGSPPPPRSSSSSDDRAPASVADAAARAPSLSGPQPLAHAFTVGSTKR